MAEPGDPWTSPGPAPGPTAGPAPGVELSADCSRCFGLCCVVPGFAASADFAIDKPAATPCPNLGVDFRCGIHTELRQRGFAGCTAYDCFGAGQRVSQVTFGGVDWRTSPRTAAAMYAAFPVVRELHELLRHLGEASRHLRTRGDGAELAGQVEGLAREVDALAGGDPPSLARVPLDQLGRRAGELLARVSALLRSDAPGPDLARRDLVGADLRTRELDGASLRGALLLGADLRGARLSRADLLGADLRGARLEGADLRESLFLTQPQVGAARGDASTRLPTGLGRPGHWR